MISRLSDAARARKLGLSSAELSNIVNRTRNSLKHANRPGEDVIEFDPEEARIMLARAVVNYQELNGSITPQMEEFASGHIRGSRLLPNDG
jgi:hypothetical protein